MRTNNKIKNYLKLGIFLFGILFALSNCMTKEIQEKEQSDILVKRVNFNKLTQVSKLKTVTSNIMKTELNFFSKSGNENSFVIDTTNIIQTSKNDVTNYSLKINRENANDYIENFIISEKNNEYKYYIITFQKFGENIEDLIMVSSIRIESNLIYTTYSGEVYIEGDIPITDPCVNIVYTTVKNPRFFGDEEEVIEITYDYSGCNNSGGDPTSNPTNPDNEDPFDNAQGNGNTADPNNSEESDLPEGAFTSNSGMSDHRECEKIKSQIDATNYNLKQELDDLMTKTSENKEYSFEVLKNGDQNHRTGTQGLGIAMPNSSVSKFVVMAHSHDAFGEGNGTLSVFSFADLQSIAKYLFQNEIKTNKFVAYLVTEKGTRLALTINDSSKLLDFFYQYNHPTLPMNSPQSLIDKWTQTGKKQDNLYKEYYKSQDDNVPIIQVTDNDNEEMLKQFLKFLKEADAGISVFEATDNNYDFKKVELDLLGNNVIRQECN